MPQEARGTESAADCESNCRLVLKVKAGCKGLLQEQEASEGSRQSRIDVCLTIPVDGCPVLVAV